MNKRTNIAKGTLKDITKAGSTMLTALYGCIGIDYNKPLQVYKINGAFTVNQILKAADADGMPAGKSTIAVLLRNAWDHDFDLATINAGGTINIDYRPDWMRKKSEKESRLDHYFRKSDFDEYRKKENAEAFVICQLKEYNNPPKAKPCYYNYKPDITKRYTLKKYYTESRGHIHKIDVIITGENGQPATINIPYRPAADPEPITSIIDKSGYLIYSKRDILKSKAAALRAEREKAAYKATNNAEQIEKLNKALQAKKAEIINALTLATTADAIKEISEKLTRWNGLPAIVADYEKILAQDAAKYYKSITDFENVYNRIFERINNL